MQAMKSDDELFLYLALFQLDDAYWGGVKRVNVVEARNKNPLLLLSPE